MRKPRIITGREGIQAIFAALGLETEKARQRYRALARPGVAGAEEEGRIHCQFHGARKLSRPKRETSMIAWS